MKIHKLQEYTRYETMAWDFINSFDALITESDQSNYSKVQKKSLS